MLCVVCQYNSSHSFHICLYIYIYTSCFHYKLNIYNPSFVPCEMLVNRSVWEQTAYIRPAEKQNLPPLRVMWKQKAIDPQATSAMLSENILARVL